MATGAVLRLTTVAVLCMAVRGGMLSRFTLLTLKDNSVAKLQKRASPQYQQA